MKSGSGEPFKTANAAKAAAASKGLDEREYKVIDFGGGYAIERVEMGDVQSVREGPVAPSISRVQESTKVDTGYRRVRFHPRSSTSEPADVVLSLNGHILLMPRGVETVLPTPYLEVAKNTTYRTFRQDPSTNRKVIVEISQYPYEDCGPSTREEYQALLHKGTRDTIRKLERSGELPQSNCSEDGAA